MRSPGPAMCRVPAACAIIGDPSSLITPKNGPACPKIGHMLGCTSRLCSSWHDNLHEDSFPLPGEK